MKRSLKWFLIGVPSAIVLALVVVFFIALIGVINDPEAIAATEDVEPVEFIPLYDDRGASEVTIGALIPEPLNEEQAIVTAQAIYDSATSGLGLYDAVFVMMVLPGMDSDGAPYISAEYKNDEWKVTIYEALAEGSPPKDELVAAFREQAEAARIATEQQERIDSQFNALNGSHLGLVRTVKESMNDPDSFEHVETRYIVREEENELYLLMDFRGNNAFGAKVLSTVEALADIDTGELSHIALVEE